MIRVSLAGMDGTGPDKGCRAFQWSERGGIFDRRVGCRVIAPSDTLVSNERFFGRAEFKSFAELGLIVTP